MMFTHSGIRDDERSRRIQGRSKAYIIAIRREKKGAEIESIDAELAHVARANDGFSFDTHDLGVAA